MFASPAWRHSRALTSDRLTPWKACHLATDADLVDVVATLALFPTHYLTKIHEVWCVVGLKRIDFHRPIPFWCGRDPPVFITADRENVVAASIHLFPEVLDRLVAGTGAVTTPDICIRLYEQLHLGKHFNRDVDFSLACTLVPTLDLYANGRLSIIMQERTFISCEHLRGTCEELLSLATALDECPWNMAHFYFRYEYVAPVFSGRIVFAPTGLGDNECFGNRMRLHAALCHIFERPHSGPTVTHVPRCPSKLFETFVPQLATKETVDPDPEFLRTTLTSDQRVTLAFMRRAETQTFYNTLGFILDDQTLVSPYLVDICTKIKPDSQCGGILANGTGKTLSALAACTSPSMAVMPGTLVNHWVEQIRNHTSWLFEASDDSDYVCVVRTVADLPVRTSATRRPILVVAASTVLGTANWVALEPMDRLFVDDAHTVRRNTFTYTRISAIDTRFVWAMSSQCRYHLADIIHLIRLPATLDAMGLVVPHDAIVPILHHLALALPPPTPVQPHRVVIPVTDMIMTIHEGLQHIHTDRNVASIFAACEQFFATGHTPHPFLRRGRREVELCDPKTTATTTFSAPDDTCAICLGSFCDPVQSTCGHVFCRSCMVQTLQNGYQRCMTCRTDWGTIPITTFRPTWYTEPDDSPDDHKTQSFAAELVQLPLTARLVVFVKYLQPTYTAAVANAGYLSATAMPGCQPHEALRQFVDRQVAVLFVHPRYVTSLDFTGLTAFWVLDQTLDRGPVERCIRRCSVAHVPVTAFVHERMFDDFLLEQTGRYSPTKGNALLLEYFLFRDSTYSDLNALMRRIFGDAVPRPTARGSILTFNDRVRVDVSTMRVNKGFEVAYILAHPMPKLFKRWRTP